MFYFTLFLFLAMFMTESRMLYMIGRYSTYDLQFISKCVIKRHSEYGRGNPLHNIVYFTFKVYRTKKE